MCIWDDSLMFLKTAFKALTLVAKAFVNREKRALLYQVMATNCSTVPNAEDPNGSSGIPSAEARHCLIDPPPVRILEQDAEDGNVSGYELLLIAQLGASLGTRRVFEIGTFDGRTTLNFAANIPDDGVVYTLDLPTEGSARPKLPTACGDENFLRKISPGARFASSPYKAKIVQLYGDSATFDYSPYRGSIDLVFIDGSHSYEYVRNDTEVALRLLKPSGGIIIWHDYGSRWWPGLTRALDEMYRARPEFASMRRIRDTTLVVWTGRPPGI